ncbi:pyruvate kinase [Lyngbya sp. PCC 8106]|uniref:pyruvate kinase n=1 Tax=Lyngbya sp. (strain PCC 8106) TaxID=313612 RepID=UPI0000EACA0E|nr:pyruvate kinase [Lyngbya sp. PCC 8106]EAW37874.1 pyruvate kinase [Lyngbya sp. PCC 8106]
MQMSTHRTKIVATIGPASRDANTLKQMVVAGMRIARLNFSHGSYEDHAETIKMLRQVSDDLDIQITLLQDLQGPKIRVGQLPDGGIELITGESLTLVPIDEYNNQPNTISIDYPSLAEEAEPGAQILLDDGLLELKIEEISGKAVQCKIVEGGLLKSRKGVNLPSLILQLPSMTEKDIQDLEFGLSQGIDWVSLSFVRRAEDVRHLKTFLTEHGAEHIPVMAKIEKPQAIENLEAIINECDGLMVARGDLGVEMSPEKVPLLQKQIIKLCNQKGVPVITATQMLESMIHNPRPTRAEASDVANAIIDGTDAVMLSGESAVGDFPVKAVEMLAKIASGVEPELKFVNYPPAESDETHALSEAINTIDKILPLKCIVAYTSTGYTAELAAAERPKAAVVAFTPDEITYHRLNLVWGVLPILLAHEVGSFEGLMDQTETLLLERQLVNLGDQILVVAGIPTKHPRGTNFLKIHRIER